MLCLEVLCLEWERLSAVHRQSAVPAIVEPVVRELAAHPQARIRLAFNEVAPDRDGMLAPLVQPEPRLSSTQVDVPTSLY